MRRLVALGLTLGLAATACSDGTADTTTTTPSTTAVAETTTTAATTPTTTTTTSAPTTTTSTTLPTLEPGDAGALVLSPEELAEAGLAGEFDLLAVGEFPPNPDPRGPCGATGDAAPPTDGFTEAVVFQSSDHIVIQTVWFDETAEARVLAAAADTVPGCDDYVTATPGGTQSNRLLGTIDIGEVGTARVAFALEVGPEGSSDRAVAQMAQIAWPGVMITLQVASIGEPDEPTFQVLTGLVVDRVQAVLGAYEGF